MWWQLRAGGILVAGALRGLANYRADLLFTVLAGCFFQAIGFAAVWVILARFDAIAGWSLTDITLLYGMRLFSHGLWILPLNQLVFLTDYIREGDFDRFLVRPANPLLQLLFTRMRLSTLGDLLGGVTLLTAGLLLADIDWSVWKILYLVVALAGGAMLEGGVQLGLSATAFRVIKADQLRFTIDQVFSMFGNYPATIFGLAGQLVLTVVIPVVFVAYLPATVLLDQSGYSGFPVVLGYLAPIVGFVVAFAGYRVWARQLRHYTSTGN